MSFGVEAGSDEISKAIKKDLTAAQFRRAVDAEVSANVWTGS